MTARSPSVCGLPLDCRKPPPGSEAAFTAATGATKAATFAVFRGRWWRCSALGGGRVRQCTAVGAQQQAQRTSDVRFDVTVELAALGACEQLLKPLSTRQLVLIARLLPFQHIVESQGRLRITVAAQKPLLIALDVAEVVHRE
eukprot:4858862-Prymnesium_polylepis.1